jgi:hypothetical protein
MKNLFLIFAMVPMLSFGQISNWRTNSSQQSTPQQQQSTPTPTLPIIDKSSQPPDITTPLIISGCILGAIILLS